MVSMNPPSSDAVVEVGDDLVGRYEAAGWVKVKAPARRPGASKQDK